ncbi:hypothetical protein M0811_00286 [Anaeramoeba ignava]|uniref:PPM-type phosphatase domain-containing protein n=1 Tax=Anaeramoeba ignava TaxID=1746090 RepID=A0A9Q0LQP1_ANAIG|nr:hypothetical protein M0811_00286 [Anaeramoeba ignava]
MINEKQENLKSVKSVGVCADRNSRFRRTMEDAHVIVDSFLENDGWGFFAVYDGHGEDEKEDEKQDEKKDEKKEDEKEDEKKDDEKKEDEKKEDEKKDDKQDDEKKDEKKDDKQDDIKEIEKKDDKQDDIKEIEKKDDNSIQITDKEMQDIFTDTYAKFDIAIAEETYSNSGATAVTCLIAKYGNKRMLYSGNVGDSRAVLCLKFGLLAVSRSFGDHSLKEFISNEPYFTATELTEEDKFLIIACDGVWDVITNEKAVELLQGMDEPDKMSKKLLANAIREGSTDNITCMVIIL